MNRRSVAARADLFERTPVTTKETHLKEALEHFSRVDVSEKLKQAACVNLERWLTLLCDRATGLPW